MTHINNYNRILTFFLLIFYAFNSNSQENKHTIVIPEKASRFTEKHGQQR